MLYLLHYTFALNAPEFGIMPEVPEPREDRFNHEGDKLVRQFFSDEDFKMTPEEYAARHAHEWGCFSFHLYRYRDPVLGGWVRRLGEILFADGEVERCRARFLTQAEHDKVCRLEAEAF